MVSVTHKGNFDKTFSFIEKAREMTKTTQLDRFGKAGVQALALATPKDSGETANSWRYKIERTKDKLTITWDNTNLNDGAKVAILLQYGHATTGGTFVKGVDYINPALKPIFDEIADNIWREMNR